MQNKTIGYGVIGCGVIATWHADALAQIENARLVGGVDNYKEAAEKFAEKYGVKAYDSLDEMLKDPQIDVVCICTPSGLHAELAIKAANAGKNIVVEKPMAITITQADAIVAACEKNNVQLTSIAQRRFSDVVQRLRGIVASGELGKLISCDLHMKYHRSKEYYASAGWRGTWAMDGGGALMNQGIHGVDLLIYLCGDVKTVYAYAKTMVHDIEVEDTSAALLEYKNGAIGVLQGTTSLFPGTAMRLEICGEDGTVIMENDRITLFETRKGGNQTPQGEEKSTSASFKDPKAFGVAGHVKQLTDMTNAVLQGRKPMIDVHEGRRPVALILAVYESAKRGEKVSVR